MKVYNYTQTPVTFKNNEIPLDRFPFIIDGKFAGWWAHNGTGINYTNYDALYILPDWDSQGQKSFLYKYYDEPNYVAETSLLCIAVIGFTFLIKLIAKLKTR